MLLFGGVLADQLERLGNRRTDAYGGSFENRVRFLHESIAAVRSQWSAELPVFVRLSVTDWVDGGWQLADSIQLAKRLKTSADIDLIDCSSGGNDPRQAIPIHPGYQVPLAAAIKSRSGLPTGAVGMLHSPDLADSIIANSQADLVELGRALMADAMWPLRAAATLEAQNDSWPVQYERSNIF